MHAVMSTSANPSEGAGSATSTRRPRAAVMADVAKLAGVSHQTVSRVLHDSPHVRSGTRERVPEAMRKLEYRPNTVARALVMGRSHTLGVGAMDTTLYGPASTLFGIERAAHDAGYFVSIISLRSLDRASVLSAVERLRDQGVDGIVVTAPQESAAHAVLHLPGNVPIVAVEAGPPGAGPPLPLGPIGGGRGATPPPPHPGHPPLWPPARPGARAGGPGPRAGAAAAPRA